MNRTQRLLLMIPIGILVSCIVLFPWHWTQEPGTGKGLYVFFGPTEVLWFNRIELNLTGGIPYRAFPDRQILYAKKPSILVRLDFRLTTGSQPSLVGIVSPWSVRRVLEPRTSFYRMWKFENFGDFSLLYFKPSARLDDIVTLEFELESSGIRELSHFEFSAILPFPPSIGERVDVQSVKDELESLSKEIMLFSVATRFKVDEIFSNDMPTFIEIDVPRDCIVKEVNPFYSIGIVEDAPFLAWDSRELKMLGRGSYPASVMVVLEEPNLRREYEWRLLLSGLLGGLFLSLPGAWLAQEVFAGRGAGSTTAKRKEESPSRAYEQKDTVSINNRLRREQTRATLAIGAIALAYYLLQVSGTVQLVSVPLFFRLMLGDTVCVEQVSRTIIALFGFYVLATAVAVSEDMLSIGSPQKNLWKEVCEIADAVAHLGYVLGASVLFLLGTLIFWPIAVVIAVIAVAQWIYRHWRTRLPVRHQAP